MTLISKDNKFFKEIEVKEETFLQQKEGIEARIIKLQARLIEVQAKIDEFK